MEESIKDQLRQYDDLVYSLLVKYQVPPEGVWIYRKLLEVKMIEKRTVTLEDVPVFFNEVHQEVEKYYQARKGSKK